MLRIREPIGVDWSRLIKSWLSPDLRGPYDQLFSDGPEISKLLSILLL